MATEIQQGADYKNGKPMMFLHFETTISIFLLFLENFCSDLKNNVLSHIIHRGVSLSFSEVCLVGASSE